MDARKITSALSVSPQISAADIANLQAMGFRSIICNRPDCETPDQPAFREIEAAAQSLGIESRYLPVQSGHVRDEDVASFTSALQDLPGPVFAYCRSGTRCATLWALGQAEAKPVTDILATAKAAGYDMSGLMPRLANGGKE